MFFFFPQVKFWDEGLLLLLLYQIRLKERYEARNPEVDLLGESFGKLDYYVRRIAPVNVY